MADPDSPAPVAGAPIGVNVGAGAPPSGASSGASPGAGSRPRLIAVATVIGWNALATVALWTLLAILAAEARVADPDGFALLAVAIVGIVETAAILISSAIGVTVTVVRARRKPDWLPLTMSTGRAILAGTRTAAWGLLVLIPAILLFVHPGTEWPQ